MGNCIHPDCWNVGAGSIAVYDGVYCQKHVDFASDEIVTARQFNELLEAEENCIALSEDLTIAMLRLESVQAAIDTVLEDELCSSEAHCVLTKALEVKIEP